MHPHDFALAILALLSELAGTVSGFGSSTFFVPSAALLEPIRLVLALSALLHCFGNVAKIALFYRKTPMGLIIRLGIPSILSAGIGALLSSVVPTETLTRFLGVALILISVFSLVRRKRLAPISTRTAGIFCGISGLATGLVGTGGAIRGMALAALQIEKNSFVTVSAAIDVGGDLLRAAIYLREGYMDWSQWFYIPSLGAAALLGAYGGRLALKRIDQKQFEKIVAAFVFASGLVMTFS